MVTIEKQFGFSETETPTSAGYDRGRSNVKIPFLCMLSPPNVSTLSKNLASEILGV